MRELFDFRVFENMASRLLLETEGQRLGPITRKVKCYANDQLYQKIGEISCDLVAKSESFFAGWRVDRYYSKQEISDAACFHLIITATFEPAGEECGTNYDETAACPLCGSGATQISALRLDLRKAPRGKDIARTIADEWIVSQRMAEQMIDAGLSGFELRRVLHKARYEDDPVDLTEIPSGRELIRRAQEQGAPHPSGQFYVWLNRSENRDLMEQVWLENADFRRRRTEKRNAPLPVWYQLVLSESFAQIVPPTRIGIHPFNEDYDGRFRCRLGDLIGLNLLSEITISPQSGALKDIFCSSEFIGLRQGLLRPRREILISPKFRELFLLNNFKGAKFEVVHLA